MESGRLAERGAAGGDGAAKGRGRGKGKGRAAEQEDEEMADEVDDDDQDDDEPAGPTLAAASSSSTSSSRPNTDLSNLPHPSSTAVYRPHTRQPLPVHHRPHHTPTPAGPSPALTTTTTTTAGSSRARPAATQAVVQEVPPRWAPAKDAKGRARQPKMGDRMDGLLAKIRKGM